MYIPFALNIGEILIKCVSGAIFQVLFFKNNDNIVVVIFLTHLLNIKLFYKINNNKL